jgi:hypothetical protein
MLRFILLTLAVLLPSAGAAQQTGSYLTFISQNDIFNSSGTRLTNVAAIIQQDRANFHRFGVRDPDDKADPWFADRAMRATISQAQIPTSDADGSMSRILRGGALVVVTYSISGGRVTTLNFVTPG